MDSSSNRLRGVSFFLIYRTTGIFHFAQGAVFAAGPYAMLWLSSVGRLHGAIREFVVALGAVLTTGLLGLGIDALAYGPLRRRGATAPVVLLASLGVYIVLQNFISIIFGEAPRTLALQPETGLAVFSARITQLQIIAIALAAVFIVLTALWTRYTRHGVAARAIGSNRRLAEVLGVTTATTLLIVVGWASCLAGIAGILAGFNAGLSPTMGIYTLMMGVVSMVVGGGRHVLGIAAGAFALSLVQEGTAWFIGARWEDTVTFAILLAFLSLGRRDNDQKNYLSRLKESRVEYALHITILAGIYAILSVSLNLVTGYMGLVSLAQAAFFGVGAYSAAILTSHLGDSFPAGLLSASLFGAIIGCAIGIPATRTGGDRLVVATFAIQVVAFNLFNNWTSLTGGPMGLIGIPQPLVFGWRVSSRWDFLLLTAAVLTAVVWACRRIVRSPVGRVIKAIREDEVFAQAAGKNAAACKVLMFTISAGMAAAAGSLYAHYISFIDPTSFTIMESIFIASIVIIGGAGSLWGPIAGALVLVSLPEILRFAGMPSPIAANVRQVVYGLLLIAFMLWRPQGLLGEHVFAESRVRDATGTP